MKKMIAVLIAALMTASLLLACGSQQSGGSTAAPDTTAATTTEAAKSEAEKTTESEAPATTTTEAPETTTTEQAKGDPYHAVFVCFVLNDNWAHQDQVKEHIREITLRDLNIDCEILPFTMSTAQQQVPLMLSAKEQIDIFSSSYPDDYYEQGYIIDLLPYEPIIREAMEKCGYDDVMASCHDGKLLALPAQLERTHHYGVYFRTDILNEAGYKDEDLNHGDFDQLGEIFEKVHELHPDMNIIGGSYTTPPATNTQHTDPMGNNAYGVLDNYGQTWDVTNYYESDYFKTCVNYFHDWYQKGLVQKDWAQCKDAGESLIKAGSLFAGACPMKPDTYATKKDKCGYDMSMFYLREDMMTAYTGSGYAISGTSPNPEEAARLLNYVFTSREFNDTINWGVEGLDWVEIADNVAGYPDGMDVSNQTYHNSLGWAYPNQRVAHVWQGNNPVMYTEIYPKAEEEAWRSWAFGFAFDQTEFLDVIGALNNIRDEYVYDLGAGSLDPSKIDELNTRLYGSGLQDIMDAKQEQLNKWREENGK